MNIAEIIQRVESKDPNFKIVKLSTTDNISEQDWKRLFDALKDNVFVQELDFSNVDFKLDVIAIIRQIPTNTQIKKVLLMGSTFSHEELIVTLNNSTSQKFRLIFYTEREQSSDPNKRQLQTIVDNIIQRNAFLASKTNNDSLDLSNTRGIDRRYIKTVIIPHLKSNPKITAINLASCSLGDDEVILLLQIIEKEKLNIVSIDLSHNNISDVGAKAISHFIKNSSLMRLELSHNKIGNDGANDIAISLVGNQKLFCLNLLQNPMGSSGFLSLARSLTDNSTLISLYINPSDQDYVTFLETIHPPRARQKRNCSIIRLATLRPIISFGYNRPRASQADPRVKLEAFLNANKRMRDELFIATRQNNLEKVKELLRAGVSPYTVEEAEPFDTILHVAAERKHIEIVRFLLDRGVLQLRNTREKTPLDIAREKNDFELVDLLSRPIQPPSSAAATPATNKRPNSDLDVTAMPEPPIKRQRLTPADADEENLFSLLHELEGRQETETVILKARQLIKSGAALEQNGEHALHLAVKNGWYRIMKLLMASPNCNVSAEDREGYTALNWAEKLQNKDIIAYLKSYQKLEAKEGELCWVRNLDIVFGSRKSGPVVIDGERSQAYLAMHNMFTQQRLAGGIQKDADGNPVTASLTFIVSNGRHDLNKHNPRITITIPLDFVSEFHVTHADEQAQAYQERLAHRMELGGSTVDFQDPMYVRNFHHGEQALLEHLEQDETVRGIINRLSGNSASGAKVYGVVLDIASPRYPCENCQKAILGEQHSESEFLEKLKSRLMGAGFKIPQVSELRMITRVGSYQSFANTSITPEEHQQLTIDMRHCGSDVILAKDLTVAAPQCTQFTSRQ